MIVYTTIYGLLLDVNQGELTATIVPDGQDKPLVIHLSDQDVAAQLGNRLAQIVGLEGEMKWDTVSGSFVSFKVSSVSPYIQCGIDFAFQQLTEAAGGAWDYVDVDAYLEEMRGGE